MRIESLEQRRLLATVSMENVASEESLPVISFTGLDLDGRVRQNEGAGGATTIFTFTIELSEPSDEPITVQFATADGTTSDVAAGIGSATEAAGGVGSDDYEANHGTLTFDPGDTQETIEVTVNNDNVVELIQELFTVTLSNPMNAMLAGGGDELQATGSIQDDDDQARVGVSAVTTGLSEGDANAREHTFEITLSKPVDTAVTVQVDTLEGTARGTSGNLHVELVTNFGVIPIELFLDRFPSELQFSPVDQAALAAVVNNIFNYITDGDYSDVFFNRRSSQAGSGVEVLQMGGFSTTSDFFGDLSQFSPTPEDGPVNDAIGLSNLRGTIGLARSGPNTGTNEIYINLVDNTNLDPLNFTVLGRVKDMSVIETIASLPVQDLDPSTDPPFDPFQTVPTSGEGELAVIQSVRIAHADFRSVKSLSVQFAPGERSKTVAVDVFGDNFAEGNETFQLALSNLTAGNRNVAFDTAPSNPAADATIADDDQGELAGGGDVIGRAHSGDWWVGRNTGAWLENALVGSWNADAGWRDVAEGDYDGDGDLDILGRADSGHWWLGRNDGGTLTSVLVGQWNEGANWRDVALGDYDHDGDLDVIGRTDTGQWWLARNDGGPLTSVLVGHWIETADWRDVIVGDYDRDGDLDLLGRGASGQWWLARNDGGELTNVLVGGWVEDADWRDVTAGDYDKDGDLDLLGRSAAGQWWLGRNDGGELTNVPVGAWVENAGWSDVALVDWDNDGDLDVIGRADSAYWWLGRNDDGALTNVMLGKWSHTADWRDVSFADYDNDGDLDILGRDANISQWWLGRNDSASLTNVLYGIWLQEAGWSDVAGDAFFDGPPSAKDLALAAAFAELAEE